MAEPKTELDALLDVIKTWIVTESGPHAKFSNPNLKLQVTIMGYKKLILERKFEAASPEPPTGEPGK